MQGSASSDIKDLESHLLELKTEATTDLQKTVFRNYTQFTQISKEIANLESVMTSMRGILGELKHVEMTLKSVAPISADSEMFVRFAWLTDLLDDDALGDESDEDADNMQSSELIKSDLTKAEKQKMIECYETIEGLQVLFI
jgi:hypothetical protein